MTLELRPELEVIIQRQMASGLYRSIDEVLAAALAKLSPDRRFDRESRREAVRRMIEFGERRELTLGEPITRQLVHEGHRL